MRVIDREKETEKKCIENGKMASVAVLSHELVSMVECLHTIITGTRYLSFASSSISLNEKKTLSCHSNYGF